MNLEEILAKNGDFPKEWLKTESWRIVVKAPKAIAAMREAVEQERKIVTAEMQKEIERLRSGIKVIEQMSDCGSYELTIVRMKQYATELLTTALTGTKHE